MTTLWSDIRYGLRQLRKNPGFTAVAMLTLALGIGANAAIFSFVNAVLLRPLPFKEPDRLVTVWERNPEQGYEQNMAATGTFLDWQEENRCFDGMAIFESNVAFVLTGDSQPERIIGAAVSANLFQVLGVPPLQGRPFTTEEQTSGRGQVAILSEGLWKRRFAADPGIVGKAITLAGQPFTVVGIMPSTFRFPGMTGVLFGAVTNQPPDVWVPMTLDADARQVRGHHSWQVVARLKSGVTPSQATVEMDAIQQRLERQYRGNFMGTSTKVVSLRAQAVGDVRLGLLILLGAVGVLLLIGCANVANLLLARATVRQKEMALRLALGASRARTVRQLLTESMLLASGGTALGILTAALGIGGLARLVPANVAASVPGWEQIGTSVPVLGFTLLVAILTALLFGLAPAWQAAHTEMQISLKEDSRGTGQGTDKRRLRDALVTAQIALSLMLLVGAGLLIQSFARLWRVNPGFQPAHLLTMQVDLPGLAYPHDADKAAFFQRLLERLKTLPGVASVGMTNIVPFGGSGQNFGIEVEGRSKDASGKMFTADWRPVTPDYFRTLGIPLVKGTGITEEDSESAQRVIVVNEAFARAFLPAEEPLGKRVRFRGENFAIVGVVHDFKQQTLDANVRVEMYTPQAQTPWFSSRTVVLRTKGEPMALAGALRSEVRALDPALAITKLQTIETFISESVAQPRFRTFLLSLFAGLALVLAAIGIYGVMAYGVARRIREIGVRMALGAQTRDVLKMILRHGMRLTFLGVVIGLVGSLALTRVLSSLLYEVKPTDPATLLAVTVLLTLVSLLACWIPARRAARIDPMVALRCE